MKLLPLSSAHSPALSLALPVVLTLAASAFALPCRAGTVEVRYDSRQAHSDAGSTPAERERNLAAVAALLRELGAQRLGAAQALDIEIVDLDLTGTLRLSRRPVGEVRVVTGRADGPRITLRYTLREGASTIRSGEESLHDAGLPRLGDARDSAGGEPLRHERTLLDRWFVQRLGAPQ